MDKGYRDMQTIVLYGNTDPLLQGQPGRPGPSGPPGPVGDQV